MDKKTFQNKLISILGQSIGQASMCWDEIPDGVFDSTQACKVLDRTADEVEELVEFYRKNAVE